eukprot:TRINITY_DN2987_c0_g2_i2.p1 TRINITY_DN2987_c0_g2~~TRINITY_DN2987_c0_g2_i2.p1  ORF type:complete len:440 (+),score=186.65 TRINITY_DN2987_c0_g2_i2:80-1399(+)
MAGGTTATGVCLGVTSKAVASLGLVLQKLAHVRNASRPKDERRGYCANPLWLCGFLVYFSGNLIGIAALTLAPQTIIAAMDALVPVFNAVYAPRILGEEVQLRDWGVNAVILAGVALVVSFGPRPDEEDREVEEQFDMLFQLPYVAYAATVLVAVAAAVAVQEVLVTERVRMRADWVGRSAAVMAGLIPAALSGFNQQFSKVFGGIVGSVFSGGDDLRDWQSWFFIVTLLSVCVVEVNRLQKALKEYLALVAVPVFQVGIVLFSVASGGLYFEEFDAYSGGSAVRPAMFSAGLLLAVVGVLAVTESRAARDGGSKADASTRTDVSEMSSKRWTLPAPATEQSQLVAADMDLPAAGIEQPAMHDSRMRATFSGGDAEHRESVRRRAAPSLRQVIARRVSMSLLPVGGSGAAAVALQSGAMPIDAEWEEEDDGWVICRVPP